MTALVIAEHDHASIKPATLNTVTAALACGGEVHVLVAGANAAEAAKAAAQIAGVTKVIAENEAWDRRRSIVDISGVAAITVALYGLETCEPVEPEHSAYEEYDLLTF